MNEELEVLFKVCQTLEEINISYVVSGSMAANYYTIPRMTRDIDVVIELTAVGVEHFTKIFEPDFWVDPQMIKDETQKRGMFNLINRKYMIKIDFILRKLNDFQESMFKRRNRIEIDGHKIWMISLEDLILAKCLWAKDSHSELQINDLRHLSTVAGLDQKYVMQWISKLDLGEIYKMVKT